MLIILEFNFWHYEKFTTFATLSSRRNLISLSSRSNINLVSTRWDNSNSFSKFYWKSKSSLNKWSITQSSFCKNSMNYKLKMTFYESSTKSRSSRRTRRRYFFSRLHSFFSIFKLWLWSHKSWLKSLSFNFRFRFINLLWCYLKEWYQDELISIWERFVVLQESRSQ